MNDNLTNIFDSSKQEEGPDFKRIVYLLLRQWKWLALFGVLGLISAFVYTKLNNPTYEASTSILVPEESKGLDLKDLFQSSTGITSNKIYNQIELIKSYYNINKTLSNLNWRTSWYKKDLFNWKEVYIEEPFDVQEASNFINLKGIAIYITPTSGDNYSIKVKGKTNISGQPVDINFEASGAYGKPFVNKYFNFTLLKKVNNIEITSGKYFFVFNDLNEMTLSYQQGLEVNVTDKKSDIIQCTIRGEEPARAVEFLNELIRVYTEGKLDFKNETERRSLNFINTQLSGISDSLNTAGEKFTEFRSQNSIIDLGAEGKLVMDNLKEIESEKAKAQMQLDYFQGLLSYLDNAADLNKLVSPSVVGIQDASLNMLVLKLSELYNRRQVVSFSARENNPTLIMIDKELNQVRTQLKENLSNLIGNATRNISSQKDRQDKISVQLNKLPQKEQKMVNIQRQFNITNELYTFLLQKRAEANITLASSTSDVQVIDIARLETAMIIGLKRLNILIIGFIFGLCFPVAYIILIGFFDTRIRSQTDLEKNNNVPILANIMHSPIKSDLVVHENPKSIIAESYRVLRTNLQYLLTGSEGKVISILSTNPGEGKSFSSISIASIIAVNNKKVLLIGADLRKPRLHKPFNTPNEKGLSTYLAGIDSINQVIVPTMIENLSLIPSGPIPPNPAELLNKPELKLLIDEVRSRFDFIIIDNAPTSMVTDGHIVSHFSDLNIFVLRYGVSHKHQIEIINEYKEKKTIENTAILMNDIKINSFGTSYYKYYQYESFQNTYYSDENQEEKSRFKKKAAKQKVS